MTPAEKNALAHSAMPELERIVGANFKRFGRHMEREEIYSAALNGLAHAIERFDASSQASIAAFARPRIQGAIYDRMSSMSHLPRRLLRQAATFRHADELAQNDVALPPPSSRTEAAHRLADRLGELSAIYVTVSSYDGNTGSIDEMQQDERIEQEQHFRRLRSALNAMPEHQKDIISKVFFQEVPLRQLAEEEGRSASWMTKKLQGALKTLRRQFESSQLDTGD